MKATLITLAVALAAGLLLHLSGARSGADRQALRCQVQQADVALQQHAAASAALDNELEHRHEAQREAQRMAARAIDDAVAAERSRISLRQRAAQLAQQPATCGGGAAAAAQPAGPPAEPPVVVLADVLGWADGRAAEAAAALDRAYAAGLTCEREHDAAVIASGSKN